MAIWDDMKDNITKAFRFVPMVDSAVDVFDLLSGKTPDQIADTKVQNMDDGLTEFGVPSAKYMAHPDVSHQGFGGITDADADEILDEDDGFFDNLGDIIGNVAGKFKVGAEDLTDNVLNTILDQFDEQTLSEKFGDVDPTMLTPDILAQIAAEDEAKRQAKESGAFWRETPVGGFLGGLENIEQGIPRGLGGAISGVGAHIMSRFDPPTEEEYLSQIPTTALSPQGLRPIAQEKIDQLHTLLDPNDPASSGEILEDLANMSAEGVLNSDIIRAWIESPQFGRGLNSVDIQRMYGTLDNLVDQITPLMDHLDQRAQGINIGGADPSWEALVRSDVLTDAPVVANFKKALQTGTQPPGATNVPIETMTDIGGHPSDLRSTGVSQPGVSASVDTGGDPSAMTNQGVNLAAQGSDAGIAGHPSREMTQDELMQQIAYLGDAEESTLETTLAEVFYTTVFSMENAGRPEVRSEFPRLLQTTSILFELYNPDVHQLFPKDEEGREFGHPEWTGLVTKNKWDVVGKAYGAFLNDFLKPGGREKYMGQLQDSIDTLNEYLARGQQGAVYRGEDVGDLDVWANAVMTKPGHLMNLAKIYRTNGRIDYTAQRIHGYLDELAGYWRNMGMSEADIFRKLTVRSPQQDRTDADDILDGGQVPPGESNQPDTTTWLEGSQFGAEVSNIMNSGQFAGMGGNPTDMRTEPQSSTIKGLSPEHLESMPTPYNETENAKRMKGLPYVTLLVKNGKRTKGTRFVPTRGYQADAGAALKKQRQLGWYLEALKQA